MQAKIFQNQKILFHFFTILTSILLAAGCSKNDAGAKGTDEENNDKGKAYKITLTINSAVETNDYLSLVTVGGTDDINETTLWNLNGEIQNNQEAISLGSNEFTGDNKTYVIESLKPLKTCLVDVQFINFNQDLKFSLKIEADGKTLIEEKNKSLSGESSDFTKNYKF